MRGASQAAGGRDMSGYWGNRSSEGESGWNQAMKMTESTKKEAIKCLIKAPSLEDCVRIRDNHGWRW